MRKDEEKTSRESLKMISFMLLSKESCANDVNSGSMLISCCNSLFVVFSLISANLDDDISFDVSPN